MSPEAQVQRREWGSLHAMAGNGYWAAEILEWLALAANGQNDIDNLDQIEYTLNQ
jgi:hypothetical protein